MGFQQQVTAGKVAHSGDPLLDTQVAVAGKLWTGKVWVFRAPPGGQVNAVYAAAGAAHLARGLPVRPSGLRVVSVPRVPR
jgi:hypothetical protein